MQPSRSNVILNETKWNEESQTSSTGFLANASKWHRVVMLSAAKHLRLNAQKHEISHFCSWWRRDSSSACRPRSEWHRESCPRKRCHSDDRREEESLTKKVRAKWKTSWIEALRERCFTAAQHDRVLFGRFLTLGHRSRFGMTLLSFWMQRERNEESQTNCRRFLIFIRNDKRSKRREIPRYCSE